MGLGSRLKKRAEALSQRAMERLFADEKRAMQIAGALGKVQRGKAALDKGQDEMLRTLNLAARGDLKALGKRLSVLKRRAREVSEKVDRLG